jgi:hypothetical protein
MDELGGLWSAEAEFSPVAGPEDADLAHRAWLRAVDRSRHWASDEPAD